MKWFFTVLALWVMSGTAHAQHRYWDANYDSLTRALPLQRTDTARLRTVVHLLDLHPRMLDGEDRGKLLAVPALDEPVEHLRLVWGIGEGDVELARGQLARERQRVFLVHARLLPYAEGGDVGLQCVQARGTEFHEIHVLAASRQRFETERARAREQVDDAGPITEAKHGLDGGRRHRAVAMSDGLVEQAQPVAHAQPPLLHSILLIN